MVPIVILASAVLLAILLIARKIRYYGHLFSESNYRAFYDGFSRALKVAKTNAGNNPPNLEDGTAFVTERGLAVSVTFSANASDAYVLHISLSQPGGITTRSVCSRFGFFTVAMLQGNKCQLAPFYTKSLIYHLAFQFRSRDVVVQPFSDAYAAYLANYKPIPFEYEPAQ